MPAAAAGAAIAGVVVLGIGAAAHKPLANVPQNTIKFAVGLLLSTFGTFWAVEGLGVFAAGGESLEWPGGDAALLALLAIWSGFAWSAIRLLRPAGAGPPRSAHERSSAASCGSGTTSSSATTGASRSASSLVLGAGALLVAGDVLADDVLMPLVGAGIVAVVSVSIVAGARR